MICPQCKQRNPIGNKFCRECGTALPASPDTLAAEENARVERERTAEKVAQFLADAFALSEQGKDDEAILLAEECARLIPQSTSAHSLLAILYERTEQEKKAIAAMERVVELNPNSDADRLKLEQLRRGVHVLPKRDPKPAPETTPRVAWLPAMVALSASVLVLSVGLSLVRGQNKILTEPVRTAANTPVSTPPAAPGSQTSAAEPSAPESVAASSSSPQPVPVPTAPTPTVPDDTARPRLSENRPRVAQAPVARPKPSAETRSPLLPSLKKAARAATLAPLPVDAVPVESPAAETDPTAASAPPATNTPPAPRRRQGYIHIEVVPTNGYVTPVAPADSPVDPPPAPNAEADPMLKAQTLQSSGRYCEAVGAYRQVINRNRVVANGDAKQGIALSQQRLGNIVAARAAYRQAILDYQAQIASGINVRMAQRGIESCRAALEVLGG